MKVPVYNLTKRLKKIVEKNGHQLRAIDEMKKEAMFHRAEMNKRLLGMFEASVQISDKLWYQSEGSDDE